MDRYGLIGYPLSHSFSKRFFTEKFAAEHIKAAYELYPIASITEIIEVLKTPGLKGLNITIPYKKQVLAFLDFASPEVNGMEACNCIKIENGKLSGSNTDIIGFEKTLVKQLKPHHTKALILGTGGAASAVEYVLRKLNIEFLFVSRSKDSKLKAMTYDEVNEELLNSYTLIINTTPLGMYPDVESCPGIPYKYLSAKHYLYDLTYNPSKTTFLKRGEEKGAAIQNGEEMLIIQAEESWRIWNDK